MYKQYAPQVHTRRTVLIEPNFGHRTGRVMAQAVSCTRLNAKVCTGARFVVGKVAKWQVCLRLVPFSSVISLSAPYSFMCHLGKVIAPLIAPVPLRLRLTPLAKPTKKY